MAWRTELNGYVKFLRGTPAAWEALATKDSDTLYFISEEGASKGKLYLGSKLISGGDTITSATTLGDLQDVLISAGITNNSILVYNSSTSKWQSTPIATVLSQIITTMTGATQNADGAGGLVPQPRAGQQNLFLRGDATWADPTADFQAQINALVDEDTGYTIREIAASEVVKLVNGAPAALDTLGELADWIVSHDQAIDVASAARRLENLEKTVNGTQSTPGLVTTVSNLNTIINGGNGTTGLVSTVSTLSTTVSNIQGDITTLNTAVDALDDRLRWQDLVQY